MAANPSAPAVVDTQQLSTQMQLRLSPLRDAVKEKGGQLVLLTYLVPGEPPAGLDPDLADVIRASRQAQAAVNQAIRQAAMELDVAIIDLEAIVDVPMIWNLDVFVDHIHLSPRSASRIAAAIDRQLHHPVAGGTDQ